MFARYSTPSRLFVERNMVLLRQLPISVCPSVLKEMQQLDTSFPAERDAFRSQCDFLGAMPANKLQALLDPLARISLPQELAQSDWINDPESFISGLTAYLWSSSQINQFRTASVALFAAIPARENNSDRLTIAVFGQGAPTPNREILTKLRPHGVLLTGLKSDAMSQQIFELFRSHAEPVKEPYAHWYIDGGTPWNSGFEHLPHTITTSYPALDALRKRTLSSMEATVASGDAGAEQMRDQLTKVTAKDLLAGEVSPDPVLQRFYTELFTKSSGPQIFSTSFVQWTGRELARRAQPQTLLLRYAPRQHYRSFDESLRVSEKVELDPEGSLRDAEMGIYYSWIEMTRITAEGKGTFLAWMEGSQQAVLIGRNAPAATVSPSPLNLEQAFKQFA